MAVRTIDAACVTRQHRYCSTARSLLLYVALLALRSEPSGDRGGCGASATQLTSESGSSAGQLTSDNGKAILSPVKGGKILKFSGLSDAIAASWPAGSSPSPNSLVYMCMFKGHAFNSGSAKPVAGSLYGADGLTCTAPAASLPASAEVSVRVNGTTIASGILLHYYAVLSFSPTVGMVIHQTLSRTPPTVIRPHFVHLCTYNGITD